MFKPHPCLQPGENMQATLKKEKQKVLSSVWLFVFIFIIAGKISQPIAE